MAQRVTVLSRFTPKIIREINHMPNHQLFQHTLQIRELNHLAKQVLAKFNYVNQFIETVPDVTKEVNSMYIVVFKLFSSIHQKCG